VLNIDNGLSLFFPPVTPMIDLVSPAAAPPPGAAVLHTRCPEDALHLRDNRAPGLLVHAPLTPGEAADAARWLQGDPFLVRALLPPCADAVGAWMADLPGLEAAPWAAARIADAAKTLAQCTGVAQVRVTLGRTVQDECRRFHADHVRLRVVCTWAGPGTHYILPWDVDPAGLRWRGPDLDAANRTTLRPGATWQQAGPGDLLWIRGTGWTAGAEALIHRSPPIAALGLRRLFWRIDTPDACGCD
jgi:hypothetical protein